MRNIFVPALFSAFLLGCNSAFAQEAGTIELGLGFGVPYGLLGAKVEYFVIDNLSLHASLGTNTVGLGYGTGAQYYFGDKNSWRPDISIHYGSYGVITAGDNIPKRVFDDDEEFEGLAIGGGVSKMWGQNGFAVGAHFILDSDLEDRKDELEKKGYEFDDAGGLGSDRFKILVGYVHSF